MYCRYRFMQVHVHRDCSANSYNCATPGFAEAPLITSAAAATALVERRRGLLPYVPGS